MKQIVVNFDNKVKPMKELHGVNCAPYQKSRCEKQNLVKECFEEIGIPFSRTHDCEGQYGGGYFVDVPNIFRNFDADENDEASYDFHYTDEYIKAIVDSGAKIVYRLGVTIEWGSKKYVCYPPKDFAKWARICEHIIMHYNEGWANGHHYDIKYWEIWNEPENPPMWTGTKEEFFDLYRVSSKHLKNRFPNIKIGGYGSCGFYALTTKKESSFMQGVLQYFYDFLDMVKTEALPFDFFSWHLYSADVNEMKLHAKFVRETMIEYGFGDVEIHFNEWNVGGEGGGFHLMRNMIGASYAASVLCELQNTDYVDKAMYYVFTAVARYNGLFDLNTLSKTCTYYTLACFGKLFKLGTQTESFCTEEGIYCTSASNGERGAILMSNYSNDKENYQLSINGLKHGKLTFYRISEVDKITEENTVNIVSDCFDGNIYLPKNSVVFAEYKTQQ